MTCHYYSPCAARLKHLQPETTLWEGKNAIPTVPDSPHHRLANRVRILPPNQYRIGAKGLASERGSHAGSRQESALDLRLDQRNFWARQREVSLSNKKRQEGVLRYRTAAILATVLIGGMFCLPTAVFAVFPNMRQGSPIPVLLGLVLFCVRFRWFLALPITTILFTLAAFTSFSRREVRR